MLLILCHLSVAAGEIQGTVHRRLLEDREEELKVGAVLLLKQVTIRRFLFCQCENFHLILLPDLKVCRPLSARWACSPPPTGTIT